MIKDQTKHRQLIDKITESLDKYSDEEVLKNVSYETGLLGYSLYYLYLSKYTGDQKYTTTAEEYFNKGLASFNPKTFQRVHGTDSLDAHLAHIGRYLIFCENNGLLSVSSEEYLLNLDQILFGLMKSKINIKDFDSGTGALAAGYYYLARLKSGSDVQEQLIFLINSIDEAAFQDDTGDYYWKCPSLYDRIYLGISHGSSLIISFLTSVCEAGLEIQLCEKIIRKATAFLIKQYRESDYKGLFPNMIGDAIEPMQFALCYGDLGIGYALLRASQLLKDSDTADFANVILNDCLLRTKEDNLTLDAGIFYGASGLAITFDKLGTLSGDIRYIQRADYWNQQILTYATHSNDFAGFKSRLLEDNILWQVSFGWGILGIGMTLMYFDDASLPSFADLTFIA
ncbi:Lanthionine synthetase C-like protein [Chryseobacterium carnipullorum]|uniref:lanthionine synthetase LanC family protein n=1 Tax=Chryseobacterium carnipullorum TaxID=1124835 RepID=UPI0009192D4B|nr:lanthionine synthetase LanC family protein [Chryseobacterium carnipullorum]SHM82634.1 Lanthionine synthetase C-like protein [Chryseobacterium carnipullorum]